ncbi:unnamed protein product [Sphagnum jensenii]|uniref:Uncharacterized protein n=1 Tax=Sphagnum jensenii TaxID=128206 RepID=A0ABP0W954_9BRYO
MPRTWMWSDLYSFATRYQVKTKDFSVFLMPAGMLGRGVIVVMPWDEWRELQLKDVADPHVVLLPMHHDLRARFNQSAAWEYAQSMNGLPYGYHNMIFSWIDTWKRPPKHQEG